MSSIQEKTPRQHPGEYVLPGPHISPPFVARASRCRWDGGRGPEDGEAELTLRRAGCREYAPLRRADRRAQRKGG